MFMTIKKGLDRCLEFAVGVTMAILVIDVVWGVFTRYVMGHQAKWTEELATFLMVWVGLLGGSVALNRSAHLGIDYFVGKLSPRKRLYTELIVFTAVTLFSILIMLIGGTTLVLRVLELNQITPALGIKMGYVYLAVPISGVFLTIYSLEFLFKTIAALAKHNESQPTTATD